MGAAGEGAGRTAAMSHQVVHVRNGGLAHARLIALPHQRHKGLQRILLRPAREGRGKRGRGERA